MSTGLPRIWRVRGPGFVAHFVLLNLLKWLKWNNCDLAHVSVSPSLMTYYCSVSGNSWEILRAIYKNMHTVMIEGTFSMTFPPLREKSSAYPYLLGSLYFLHMSTAPTKSVACRQNAITFWWVDWFSWTRYHCKASISAINLQLKFWPNLHIIRGNLHQKNMTPFLFFFFFFFYNHFWDVA
jgi:hypothetical protein